MCCLDTRESVHRNLRPRPSVVKSAGVQRFQYLHLPLSLFRQRGQNRNEKFHKWSVSSWFMSVDWLTFFLKKIFVGTHILSWGHLYPCFGLLVMSPLGFKARVGSLIHTWQRCTWCRLPEIHLWCNICQPLMASMAAGQCSPHACFSRGRMLDSNGDLQLDWLT